jgi:hypothetical protein
MAKSTTVGLSLSMSAAGARVWSVMVRRPPIIGEFEAAGHAT